MEAFTQNHSSSHMNTFDQISRVLTSTSAW